MNQEAQRIEIQKFLEPHLLNLLTDNFPHDPFSYYVMHEAEKALTKPQRENYLNELDSFDENVEWALCHATAPQRAEAFLKTLNLWKE